MQLVAIRVNARMVTLVITAMLISMNVSPLLAYTVSFFYGHLHSPLFRFLAFNFNLINLKHFQNGFVIYS